MIFLITGPGHCVLNVALLGLSAVEARELHSFLKLRVIVRYYGKGAKIILEAVLFASLSASHGTKKPISYYSRGRKKILFFFFRFGNVRACACVFVCVCMYKYTYETGGFISSHHPNQEILTSVGLETVSQNLR